MKDLTGSTSTRSAAVPRNPREARRWPREVLRRGILETLYLGSNLAIAGAG